MNEKGLMEQSDAAIKAALELYAADHGKLNDGDSFTTKLNNCVLTISLKDVTDETQLKAKILEWLTRTAIKAVSPKERKLHFEGINKLLGTNFTLEKMTDIYTYLGNGINHDLCVKFVESGYDMTLLPKEV